MKKRMAILLLSLMLTCVTGNLFAQYIVPGNVVVWEWPPSGLFEIWEWDLPSSISGRILEIDGQPVSSGFEVIVTLQNGVEETKYTDNNGYYYFTIPDSYEYGNVHIYVNGGSEYISDQINLYYTGDSLTWNFYLNRSQ